MLTGEKLGRAIDDARTKKGLSKADLARQFGVKPPSVQGWIKNGRISKENFQELVRFFSDVVDHTHWDLPSTSAFVVAQEFRNSEIHRELEEADLPLMVADEKPGYKERPDVTRIRRFDVNASMGAGASPDNYPDVVENITVSTPWLRQNVTCTSTDNLALITGLGDSMENTFSDGDLLLVDRGVRKADLDAVYAFTLGEHFYIKRLQRRPDGSFLMISDNPKYPPYVIENGERESLDIQARVILAWNARKL